MIDALLVCFAEHYMSPSSLSARMVMSGAGYIMPALAGGILSIGYVHVDAHEEAQTWIAAVKLMKEKAWTCNQTADYLCNGIRNKEKDTAFVKSIWRAKRYSGMTPSATYSRFTLSKNH